jgi:hypothetical protein
VIRFTNTDFHHGEPLVVQIDTQGSFYLTAVAQHQTGGTYQVERNLEASEDGYRVLLHAKQFLRMGGGRYQKQSKTNSEP